MIVGTSKVFVLDKILSFSDHNHDDRYYTESEINTKLSAKANTSDLNSLKTSVSNGKSAVASAITGKGVSTSATASFDTMASNIRSIKVNTTTIVAPTSLRASTRYNTEGFSCNVDKNSNTSYTIWCYSNFNGDFYIDVTLS